MSYTLQKRQRTSVRPKPASLSKAKSVHIFATEIEVGGLVAEKTNLPTLKRPLRAPPSIKTAAPCTSKYVGPPHVD